MDQAIWLLRSAYAAVGCALLLSHPTEHRLFAAFRGSAVCTPLLAAHCLRRSAHAAVGCVLPSLHPTEVVISTTKNTSPKEVHLFLSFGITPRGSGCNCAIVDAEHLCSPCN